MENETFDANLKEVVFYYSAEPDIYTERDCALYLNNEELQQVYAVLDTNPEANFAELPKKLYDAFMEAARHSVEEENGGDFRLQAEMPVDLLEYWLESKGEKPNQDDEDDVLVRSYKDDDGDPDFPEWINEEIPEKTKENSLYLTIKQAYFDLIMSGEKQIEYRELKDSTYKRYIMVNKNGEPMLDEEFLSGLEHTDFDSLWEAGTCPYIPKDIYYLDLAVGYNKDRDTAVVEVGGFGFEPSYDQVGERCWVIKFFINRVVECHKHNKG